jgi:hypothetical protein
LPKDLISRNNEVVLRTVSSKAEANYHDDSGVALGQIAIVPIVKKHVRKDRVLKSPASLHGLQNLAILPMHFRMLFTDMVPAFIGQINFMTQLILDRSKHRARLQRKRRIFAIASRIIDVGLIAGQGSSTKEKVPRNLFISWMP